MTKLLLKIFIKNPDISDTKVRAAIGRLAGVTGIVCNVILFIAKLVTGILTGSVSVIADAVNNLSDASSSLVTLLGFRLARRPADADHPYGHARYEYLSGLAVSVLILVIGAELVKSSVSKIFAPVSVSFTTAGIVILVISIVIKLWMSVFYSKLSKLIDSTTLKATSLDSRNDVITTLTVLIGAIIGKYVNIDGYIGLAVALFILYSGFGIAKETVSPLLGGKADKALTEEIEKIILSHDKILGIHDLLVHDYGPGQCYASVHTELSSEENPMVCHDIIDDIECDVLEKLNVHLVIHYDPVVKNDSESDKAKSITEKVIKEIDSAFSMHDFRLVKGAQQTKLVFDLAVPYSIRGKYRDIKETVERELANEGLNYITVIRFDEKE